MRNGSKASYRAIGGPPPDEVLPGYVTFAIPDLYKTLEAESYFYAIRLRTNRLLQSRIARLLKRPVGRPPKDVRRIYGVVEYQAASWGTRRGVFAKVE